MVLVYNSYTIVRTICYKSFISRSCIVIALWIVRKGNFLFLRKSLSSVSTLVAVSNLVLPVLVDIKIDISVTAFMTVGVGYTFLYVKE